jgi:hypothetical protein
MVELDSRTRGLSNAQIGCAELVTVPVVPLATYANMRLSLLGGIAAISTTFAQNLPPLPEVPGANISRGLPIENTKLVHYISSNVSFANATKALIVIHGALRDPWNSFVSGQIATGAAAAEGLLKNEEVVIDAPVFLNRTFHPDPVPYAIAELLRT